MNVDYSPEQDSLESDYYESRTFPDVEHPSTVDVSLGEADDRYCCCSDPLQGMDD